ncbi:MAG TPA: hypothetical protein VGR29_11800 [Thermomicrobiales bacterium]|nr:hypothetical protein [Thermomicrobiales bacterium]
MKRRAATVVLALAFSLSLVHGAMAAPTVSDNASHNACFGQARADYAIHRDGPEVTIPERGGENPAENAAWTAEHCS